LTETAESAILFFDEVCFSFFTPSHNICGTEEPSFHPKGRFFAFLDPVFLNNLPLPLTNHFGRLPKNTSLTDLSRQNGGFLVFGYQLGTKEKTPPERRGFIGALLVFASPQSNKNTFSKKDAPVPSRSAFRYIPPAFGEL
jgi:hypothetical protein